MTVMVGVAQQAATFEGTAQGHVSLTVASRQVNYLLVVSKYLQRPGAQEMVAVMLKLFFSFQW